MPTNTPSTLEAFPQLAATAALIRSILGIGTLSGSNTGDQDLSGLATTSALANKVDKVADKSLVLNTEITKLFGLQPDGYIYPNPSILNSIQTAYAGGATRVKAIPGSTYQISSTITVPDGGTLDMEFAVLNCNNVSGFAIRTNATPSTLVGKQTIKNVRITGTAGGGVLWVGSPDNGLLDNISLSGLTATNGFVFAGVWASTFTRLYTNGATISNAPFWIGRDFLDNHCAQWYTSNFSPYSLYAFDNATLTGYSGGVPPSGNTFNVVACQGSQLGLGLLSMGAGNKFNTPYFENVVKIVQYGDNVGNAARSVKIDTPIIVGPAVGSTVMIDIYNLYNCSIDDLDCANWADTGPLFRYKNSHYLRVNGFYSNATALVSNSIRRIAGGDSDGGVWIEGEEVGSSGARCHFTIRKADNYGYEHYKETIGAAGARVVTTIVPAVYP